MKNILQTWICRSPRPVHVTEKKIQYFLALMMTFANKVAKFRTTFQFSELIRILLVITLGTYKTMPRQQSMKTLTGHHRRRKFPVYFIYSLLKCKSLPNNWKFKKNMKTLFPFVLFFHLQVQPIRQFFQNCSCLQIRHSQYLHSPQKFSNLLYTNDNDVR